MGPRILLVNHWHDDNKGDSAITAATVSLLKWRYPGARVTVSGLLHRDEPAYASSFRHLAATHPDVALIDASAPVETTFKTASLDSSSIRTAAWVATAIILAAAALLGFFPRSVQRRVRGADLVVVNGGSNVYDDPNVKWPQSLARLTSILLPLLAASAENVPVIGIGHTIGPFPRRIPRRFALTALRRLAVLHVRDDVTAEMLQANGIDAGRAPDVAFAIHPHPSDRLRMIVGDLPRAVEDSLVICLRQQYAAGTVADHALADQVGAAARQLVAGGPFAQVIVVPHTVGPTDVEDDRPMADYLVGALNDIGAVLIADDLSPEELCWLYGSARAVLAMRLHAAILSIAGGAPAVAISYFTTKTAGAIGDVGLPCSWLPWEGVTSEALTPRLCAAATGSRQTMAGRVEELRRDIFAAAATWPDLP